LDGCNKMRNCCDIHDKGDSDGYGGSWNDGCSGGIYNSGYCRSMCGVERRVCLLRVC